MDTKNTNVKVSKKLINIPKLTNPIGVDKAKLISPLTLAYVGDSVYSLFVRVHESLKGDYKSGELTKLVNKTVSAKAQSEFVKKIEPLLTEEEFGVYKRAKNAKTHNYPTHATISEYHEATGFEALIGYLYLTGQSERIDTLLGENYAD